MIKDPQTMFTALKTGEIDGAARSVSPELVKEWAADPQIELAQAPSLWGTWLDVNYMRAPFDQPLIRRAVALAVDPDPMLERIMLGHGKSGLHGWPHVDSFWTRPDLDVPYLPDEAAAILDQEGFTDQDGDGLRDAPDGTAIDWSIKVASNQPLFQRAAGMVVSQLAEVGLRSHVETIDPAGFAALWSSREFDLRVTDITPHGLADQDMEMIMLRGDLQRVVRDDPRTEIMTRWLDADTRERRLAISYELQDYQNRYPDRIMLWYPDGIFAYRWQAFDNYASSSGYGIYHKYSFLPPEVRGDTGEPLAGN
jgi:peptide/nickel transport system substrate-binding protein